MCEKMLNITWVGVCRTVWSAGVLQAVLHFAYFLSALFFCQKNTPHKPQNIFNIIYLTFPEFLELLYEIVFHLESV